MPSGWHHTVENIADTLSVNANWLNAFNLHWACELLRRERAQAAAAIEDCRCAQGPLRNVACFGSPRSSSARRACCARLQGLPVRWDAGSQGAKQIWRRMH